LFNKLQVFYERTSFLARNTHARLIEKKQKINKMLNHFTKLGKFSVFAWRDILIRKYIKTKTPALSVLRIEK